MFPNFLIGLREGLEAALVVGILVAYMVRTGHRDRLAPIWTGVLIAVAASFGVGALLTYTSHSLSFKAQEAFGGFMSIAAVGFVTWMIFWMRRQARFLKGELHGLQEASVLPGLHSLAFDVSSAVPPSSWYGTLLKGVFNFSPETTWLQLVAYVGYIVPTLFLFFRPARAATATAAAPSEARTPAAASR